MFFRHLGTSIQFLRTEYDPALKRGKQVVVGKVGEYDRDIPAELAAKLTPDELAAGKDYLDTLNKERDKASRQFSLDTLALALVRDRESLGAGLVPRDADQLWQELIKLERALKAAGFPRPKKKQEQQELPL